MPVGHYVAVSDGWRSMDARLPDINFTVVLPISAVFGGNFGGNF